MRKRSERLARIAHVQAMLQQASEIRLAALQREETNLRERQMQLIAALNDPHPVHGLFVNAMANHLSQSDIRRQHIAQIIAAENQTRLKAELSGRAAQKLSTEIARTQAAESERHVLEELSAPNCGKPASDKQMTR